MFEKTTTAHITGVIAGVAAGHLFALATTLSGGRLLAVIFLLFYHWLLAGLAITAVTLTTTIALRLLNARARLPPMVVYPVGAALLAWPIMQLLNLRPEWAVTAGIISSFVAGLALAFAPRDEPELVKSLLWTTGRTALFAIVTSLVLLGFYALLPLIGGSYP